MTRPTEIERAQRFVDRHTSCHPSQLPPEDPVRILFDVIKAYDDGALQIEDEEDGESFADDAVADLHDEISELPGRTEQLDGEPVVYIRRDHVLECLEAAMAQ